jgi:hypothetical protein
MRRTTVARLKRVVHHALHNVVDVGRVRIPRAIVHGRLVGQFVRGVAGLFMKINPEFSVGPDLLSEEGTDL